MASAKLIWYVYVTSFFCKYIFTRNINHRYFNFLFEPPSLKMPLICSYLLSIFTLTTLEKCITELMKSSHASILNLIRRNLAIAEKNCLVLYHTAASIKLYILTYSVLEMQYKITSSTQCHNDHLMLKTNQFYMTVASVPDVIDDADGVLETLQSTSFELKRLNELSKFFLEGLESIFSAKIVLFPSLKMSKTFRGFAP